MRNVTVAGLMLMTVVGMGANQQAGADQGVEQITPASPGALPLRARHGERFHFVVGYLGLVGAKARVAVDSASDSSLRFTADVEHTLLLQFIFRIRDRFTSQFSTKDRRTIRTQLWQHENSMRRYREESFLGDRVVSMERKDEEERTLQVDLRGPALDPLSALFWVRGQKLEVGDHLSVPMFANNRQLEVRAHVRGIDTVRALGRNHQALRLDAVVYRDGQPVAGAEGTFWVSQDEAHTPLRVEASTDYGKVSATLDQMDP